MQKNNKGVLFKNKKKETEKHPDYTGSATINNQEFWLSAWVNKAKDSGESYMSISYNPKEINPSDITITDVPVYDKNPSTGKIDIDEDIPF